MGQRTTSPCAMFTADVNLYGIGGMIFINNGYNITIDHIFLNGNRAARMQSQAADDCLTMVMNVTPFR